MFWRLALATCWWLTSVVKNACFAFRRQFLKLFFSFSLKFLWLFIVFSISLSTETNPNPPQTPFLHHFFLNIQEKVWVFSVSLHFPCFESAFLDSVSVLLPLCIEKYHARSTVCFILVSVYWLRVSVFDFITGVYMKSGVCALFHDSGCFIHIMFVVFCHIICQLNPRNA